MPSKKPKKNICKHDGDFFPVGATPQMERDPLLGWVAAVQCGKCGMRAAAALNFKNLNWEERAEPNKEHKDLTNKELVELYGPFKRITRQQEATLAAQGKWLHILTIIGCDVPYEDLAEDNRPSDEELKDRGETRENHMGYTQEATVGHHLVNVDEIFESAKPMPDDLVIHDFWFDETHLKAP